MQKQNKKKTNNAKKGIKEDANRLNSYTKKKAYMQL
jgi:hypothetical protein